MIRNEQKQKMGGIVLYQQKAFGTIAVEQKEERKRGQRAVDSSVKDVVYGKNLFQRMRGLEEGGRSIESFKSSKFQYVFITHNNTRLLGMSVLA